MKRIPKRHFWIWQNTRTGELSVATNAPKVSKLLPDKTPRAVVEMKLDRRGTDVQVRLAELWVANTLSLDRTLELLTHAPRVHTPDISCAIQSLPLALQSSESGKGTAI